MVQSVARGQFRVTWAADGLPSIADGDLPEPTFPETAEGLVPEDLEFPESVPPPLEDPPDADLPVASPERPKTDAPEEPPAERTEPPPEEAPAISLPKPPAPAVEGERPALAPVGPPRRAEPEPAEATVEPSGQSVRRPPRAPFRVVSSWLELPPLGAIEEEEEAPEDAEEASGPPLVPALRVLAQPSMGSPTAPPPPPPPAATELAALTVSPATPGPAPSPPAPSQAAPSRTLVGLLARMWLMRATGPTAGGLAIGSPPAPSAPSPPSGPGAAVPAPPLAPGPATGPPGPTAPASAEPSLPPAPSLPTSPSVEVEPSLPAPAAPPAPALPVTDLKPGPTVPPPLPVAPPLPEVRPPPPVTARRVIHTPDVEDRRPLSGLATFLVEVAAFSNPPHAEVVPTAGPGRVQVVPRLVHCPYPIPERPVSRDSCHRPRVVR